MAIDIDLDDYKPGEVDTLGDLPAEGKYHVRLDGAVVDHKAKSGLTGKELTFVILTGRNAGYKVTETLWDNGSDDAKTRKAKDRQVRFGKRLGLFVVAGEKLKIADGKHDFNDCLGTEVVIEVKHEQWESQGKKGTSLRMTMFGIWGVDDPEVKDVPKANRTTVASIKAAEPAKPKAQAFDPNEL
jgi:hypothetical protein